MRTVLPRAMTSKTGVPNQIRRGLGEGIDIPRVTAPGASEWPRSHKERQDFYHHPRAFPHEIGAWRKGLVARAGSEQGLLPAADTGVAEVRGVVDDGIAYLRTVSQVLDALYGTPGLGNKADPVDELVYIILSRKTREDAYQLGFDKLKARFDSWDDLLGASRKSVEKLISAGGLSGKKTESLFAALETLKDRFGSCTLEPVRDWSDEEVEEFLCSLPEIERKSAYCIMLFSLGRSVFPVDTHVGRILARLGPYRELGLDLEGLGHKQLQRVLADLIPPPLRYSLHVNLVAHGREVCKARNPLCSECALTKLCQTYRRAEQERVVKEELPVVVDMFSGAGGISLGFSHAGFRTAIAIDFNAPALHTFRFNHPEVPDDRILCTDVRELEEGSLKRMLKRKRPQVLIGAPPCQGFSHAGFRSRVSGTGYRLSDDARNYLYQSLVLAAIELKPWLFLMENVPGMKSAKQGEFLENAARMLEEGGGFKTAVWKLSAASYGVPQERSRYFLVGSRCKTLPARPEPEYEDNRAGAFDDYALPQVTLDDAIFDLPPVAADSGESVTRHTPPQSGEEPRTRRYLRKFGLVNDSGLIYNHTVRYHNEADLELYANMMPGDNQIHAIEAGFKSKHGKEKKYRADVFDDKFDRLRGDRPSRTIVAHLAKDGNSYIHPHQVRSISIREGARLQSFPDDFAFCGSPSDQWVQLGNAVPPLLARAIGRTFMSTLRKEGKL